MFIREVKGGNMMRPIVEFCASNARHGTEVLMKKLEVNVEYDVLEYGCLGNCGQCYMEPYAFVNGDVVSADHIELLETKIYQKLKDHEDMLKLLSE